MTRATAPPELLNALAINNLISYIVLFIFTLIGLNQCLLNCL